MGEIESRKEFITRIFLIMQEIPEKKRKDLNTMLGFLSIQLREREMDFAKYATKKVIVGLSDTRALTLVTRSKIVDMFEGAFSETDYMFKPVPTEVREEFLLSKNTLNKGTPENLLVISNTKN